MRLRVVIMPELGLGGCWLIGPESGQQLSSHFLQYLVSRPGVLLLLLLLVVVVLVVVVVVCVCVVVVVF